MPQAATLPAVIRTRRRAPRALGLAIAAGCLALVLAGCAPEPQPGASAPASAAPSVSAEPTAAPSEPAPSANPSELAALPADCQAIYSPGMLQTLSDANPPLNHPGVTMNATEVVGALELLAQRAQLPLPLPHRSRLRALPARRLPLPQVQALAWLSAP